MDSHASIVYLLGDGSSPQHCRCSYVGVTNHLRRRLRQHCGQISGGARYTKRSKNWVVMAVVGGLPSRQAALQLEWALKRVRVGRTPMQRRAIALWTVLSRTTGWTRSSPSTAEVADSIWVWWTPGLAELASRVRDWSGLPLSVRPCICIESIWEQLYP